MKKIIMLALVLVTMTVSIGGCFVPWHDDGRDGRDRGHDRGHDRDRGPDRYDDRH